MKKRTEKEKAARKLAQGKPGGESKYARKIRGDYPLNSPYRTIWSQFKPFGAR